MKKRTKTGICIIIALVVVFTAAAGYPLMLIHETESSRNLEWELGWGTDMSGSEGYYLTFRYTDENRMVRGTKSFPDGAASTENITVSTCGVPLFGLYQPEPHRIFINEDYTITLNDDIVLYDRGVIIGRFASELYALATPYVGDIVQNEKILTKLGVDSLMGRDENPSLPGMTHKLKTSEPPYEWTVRLNGDLIGFEKASGPLAELQSYSCVLLAMIGNLDAVNWAYSINGEAFSFRYDTAEASDLMEKDIKSYGDSAADLQRLLEDIYYLPKYVLQAMINEG